MSKCVVLINGATGIGKTTAAITLAKKYEKGVSVDVDTVKHFIKTGILGEMIEYMEEIESMKENNKHQWYYTMIVNIVCDIAERFLTQGYMVTISDMVWENWIVELYKKRLTKYSFFQFMLELPYKAHEERLIKRLKKDNVFHTYNEAINRIKAFSHAMQNIAKENYIPVNIENMNIEEVGNKIYSHIIRKASSQ